MKIDKTEFCRRELCELSGAKPSQVEHWVHTGVIVPLKDIGGQGHRRVFSERNIFEAMRAAELVTAGVTVKGIRAMFNSDTDAKLLTDREWMALYELRSGRAVLAVVDEIRKRQERTP